MRVQIIVPVAICVSVALLGIIKLRKTEQEKEEKRNRFQSTKLRVTNDVLREYTTDKEDIQKKLDKLVIERTALEDEATKVKAKADAAKSQADGCQGSKKSSRDEIAKMETQISSQKAEADKEKVSWKTELDALNKKLAAPSPVCGFLKKDAQAANKLCGIETVAVAPKKEEPKAEEAKKEEPKKEEPKKEEPKAEETKKEEPKKEEPKKEEPKKEEPKKEEPKKR